ncbi:MAG: adenylate/guanylate cyclase domain-containing protein [Cyanobacteria bacterium P01_H01_bin.119]
MSEYPGSPAKPIQPAALIQIERALRLLLPADLYAAIWIDPSSKTLMQAFDHLRTLQYMLHNYVPPDVIDNPPVPGVPRYRWRSGSLMFTDLAGFTPLSEAKAAEGQAGAEGLLRLLNDYFAQMIEIISKSGGKLLEFTGDALLVQFTSPRPDHELAQSIHAGLRMQRAMANFSEIQTIHGPRTLRMRVGIHSGQFITADIGTPMRMGHVLLGRAVQVAKQAEGAGKTGQVSVTQVIRDRIEQQYHLLPRGDHHWLIDDTLTADTLGEYDVTFKRRRLATSILFDRSVASLISELSVAIARVETLSSYIPRSVLGLLVNSVAQRKIPPAFPTIPVIFVNLIGLPEAVDEALPEETEASVQCFSQAFALINGTVERQGGILQKVTYHSVGSEMLIHFGVLNPDEDDAKAAASAILSIQQHIEALTSPTVQGRPIKITYRIGFSYGPVFAAEIGEPRGRREFNILGDTVNIAARLMSQAQTNQVLLSEAAYQALKADYRCESIGELALKGKRQAESVYTLLGAA